MLKQLSDASVPLGLRGPVLIDQLGLPRYWAAVWSATSAAQLADSTHVKRLRYIENLYQHADQLLGESRSRLLAEYQQRQSEYRRWRGRVAKRSGADTAASLAEKDIRIAELEATVQLLTASHLAMLRAVGELGGFSKWARFYEQYREARDKLIELGAVPAATVSPMEPNSRAKRQRTAKEGVEHDGYMAGIGGAERCVLLKNTLGDCSQPSYSSASRRQFNSL